MFCGFQNPQKFTLENSNNGGLSHIKSSIVFPTTRNTFLLVAIKKFDPHPIFVNVNKLKPCQFFEISRGWEPGVQGRGGISMNNWNGTRTTNWKEDDKQLEVNGHLVITPPEQFFNKESRLNEVLVTPK